MSMISWSDLKTTDFSASALSHAIAVLPLGATEQHGPHLPLSTDTDLVTAVLEASQGAVPDDLTVLVLPPLPIGLSPEHLDFPGTLSFTSETMLAVLKEIGGSVAAAGIRKLVFFNGHGGNVAMMDIAARDLRVAHGLLVAHTSWTALADMTAHIDDQERRQGIHAGLIETSAMLTARPDLVAMEDAKPFLSHGVAWEAAGFSKVGIGGKPAKLGWLAKDLNADGVMGDASKASAETGEALISSAASSFVALLDEFRRLPLPSEPE